MNNPPVTSYDVLPYGSRPFSSTHPASLAAVAHLFGLSAPAPQSARVLEIGCAAGGNLIPMAAAYPDGHFLGIDLSARQIEDGRRLLDALSLDNIELRAQDLMEFDAEPGSFDYIISHGVFSWIPPAVQDRLLDLYGRLLSPNGVAYISYNTYPGWHFREIVRDAMLYRCAGSGEPAEKVAQARALLSFMGEAAPAERGAYGVMMAEEIKNIVGEADYYLYHEYLESDNRPCYFHQFVERGAGVGLQYLGESNLGAMFPSGLTPAHKAELARIGPDLVQFQQYLDFLRNRSFRCSLLCRQEVPLTRAINGASLRGLYLSTVARAEAAVDFRSQAAVTFVHPVGTRFSTSSPVIKAAFLRMAQAWPQSLVFEDLIAGARRDCGLGEKVSTADLQAAGNEILGAVVSGIVGLHTVPHPLVAAVSARPRASALARAQVSAEHPFVTNQRHKSVPLDAFCRALVSLLDGSRSRKQLHVLMLAQCRAGLSIERNGVPLTEADDLEAVVAQLVDDYLEKLASNAFLIA